MVTGCLRLGADRSLTRLLTAKAEEEEELQQLRLPQQLLHNILHLRLATAVAPHSPSTVS